MSSCQFSSSRPGTGGDEELSANSVVVTTIAGSGQGSTKDGIGTAADLFRPSALSYSKGSHSLLFVQAAMVRRMYLPATKEIRASLAVRG